MYRKNWISTVILIGFGVLLNGLYFAGLADDFWSGLGTAFIFAAAVRLVRMLKYKNNSQYPSHRREQNKSQIKARRSNCAYPRQKRIMAYALI